MNNINIYYEYKFDKIFLWGYCQTPLMLSGPFFREEARLDHFIKPVKRDCKFQSSFDGAQVAKKTW